MVGLFVTMGDCESILEWSGTPWFMRHALEKAGIGIRCFRSPPTEATARAQMGRLPSWYTGERSMRSLATHARRVEETLARRGDEIDFVFCPGTIPISRVKTTKPIISWTDATFDSMVGFYGDEFAETGAGLRRAGHRQESLALRNVAAAVYSSEWAAGSAVRDHGANPSKVHVVPFGANIINEPSRADVVAWIEERLTRPLELVFIAVDWERKGGALVVQVVNALRARGISVELTIIGPVPDSSVAELPPGTTAMGFLDKSSEAESLRFAEALRRASFLLLPSKAEAFGIVLAEACAYGVPLAASDVGGILTTVRDGVNGRAFSACASPDDYADFTAGVWGSPDTYRALALGARAEFEMRLNWHTAVTAFAGILRDVVPDRAGQTEDDHRLY